jgi:hypothetical protein
MSDIIFENKLQHAYDVSSDFPGKLMNHRHLRPIAKGGIEDTIHVNGKGQRFPSIYNLQNFY